jgi:hypothetical protein
MFPQGVRLESHRKNLHSLDSATSGPRIGFVVVNRGSRGAAGSSHVASDRHHKEKVTCICGMIVIQELQDEAVL